MRRALKRIVDVEALEGDLAARMIAIQVVDGAIDLLPHRTRQLEVARRGQALSALLLQACAQLGFALTFLPIALVALGERALEGAIALAH